MPQNDNAFKVMIEKSPEQFLARILPGAELIEVLNGEMPRESLYVDALLRVRYHGKEYILHLEVQTAADPTTPGRILQYLGLILLRYRLPVLPVVIWLFPVNVPASPWQMEGPDEPIVSLRFRSIKLWEEPVEEWLAAGAQAPLIFTPLLKGATIENVGAAANQMQALPDPNERGSAINYLVLFAVKQFGRDAVLGYFKENPMLNTFVTQSEWYQEILQRGKLEGEKIGELQGKQSMAQRALEGRFGTVPEDILAALPQADENALEAIVLHITTDTVAKTVRISALVAL